MRFPEESGTQRSNKGQKNHSFPILLYSQTRDKGPVACYGKRRLVEMLSDHVHVRQLLVQVLVMTGKGANNVAISLGLKYKIMTFLLVTRRKPHVGTIF